MSTSGSGLRSTIPPTYQADATITQANPVSGTQYEVLATTLNCRILSIGASTTWTVQNDPLEIWVTIDGQTIRHQQANPVSTTVYSARRASGTENFQDFTNTPVVPAFAFLYEGKSVRVQAETTGGTVQQLYAVVKYQKW